MANPVLVEVIRGGYVESRHRGAVCVVDAAGGSVLALGDVDRRVFPRSGIKLFQALPLVESGAADAVGFGARELALACSSHNAEKEHVAGVEAMLEKAGLSEARLACGPQPPRREADLAELIRAGLKPRRIHNNCSGKHAGMLAHAAHAGIASAGYEKPSHPLQREIAAVLEQAMQATLADAPCGVDGCSLPTYAVPLRALALAFARAGAGTGMGETRAEACHRLMRACMREPFMVAGTGRFCTTAMALAPGRVFVKTGAEGIFCGAFPELGLGIEMVPVSGTVWRLG